MLCSLVPFQSVPPGPQGWRPPRSERTRAEGQQDGSQALVSAGPWSSLGTKGEQEPQQHPGRGCLHQGLPGHGGLGRLPWWESCCCLRLTDMMQEGCSASHHVWFVHSWTDGSPGDPRMPSHEGPTWVRKGQSSTSGRDPAVPWPWLSCARRTQC